MVGSHVARELHDRGEPVRAYVRDPGKAAGMLGPTLPLAVGELGDRAASAAALVGVDRVLLCLAQPAIRPSSRWPRSTHARRPGCAGS